MFKFIKRVFKERELICKHEIIGNGYSFVICQKCGTINNSDLAAKMINGFFFRSEERLIAAEKKHNVKILIHGGYERHGISIRRLKSELY